MLLEEVREKFGNGIKDCSSTVATPDTEPEYARQDTDENRSKVGTIDTQVDKEIDNLVEQLETMLTPARKPQVDAEIDNLFEQLETMLTPARKLKMGELVILD